MPGFGDPEARLLLVGLAPAAHGGNRTGRVFTGDNPGGSGELLFEALHRAGFSPRPRSLDAGDGLRLRDAYIAAVNRCAPPDNKPTTSERDACLPYLVRELRLLPRCASCWPWAASPGTPPSGARRAGPPRVPGPASATAAEARVGPYELLGCYHPSQQNTFTGRLTASMLDAVLAAPASLSCPAEGGLPHAHVPPGGRSGKAVVAA